MAAIKPMHIVNQNGQRASEGSTPAFPTLFENGLKPFFYKIDSEQ